MPPSVPPGLRLELARARVLAGREDIVDEWMTMLHDRHDEVLQTLPGERMALEATFRLEDADGTTWLFHLSVLGEGGGQLDLTNPVDVEHERYAQMCKERGWEELEPLLLIAPVEVLSAVAKAAGLPGP